MRALWRLVSTRQAALLLVLAIGGLCALLAFRLMWIGKDYWRRSCPSGTFAANSLNSLELLVGLLALSWILYLLIWGMKIRDEAFARPGLRSIFIRRARQILTHLILSAVLLLCLFAVFGFRGYCAMSGGVIVAQWPWTAAKHYQWQDATRVQVDCRKGRRSGYSGRLHVTLGDSEISFMEADLEGTHYGSLSNALRFVPFKFEDDHVPPACEEWVVRQVPRRPGAAQPYSSPVSEELALAISRNERGYPGWARPVFRTLAAAGDPVAQVELGNMYTEGRGVKADPAHALSLYRRAAMSGEAAALNAIAVAYDYGAGVPADRREAIRWYGLAIAAGSPAAMNNIGLFYYHGIEVPVDYAKARELWESAATLGYAPAMNNLAELLEKGLGGPRDREAAIRWWRVAAAHGIPAAVRSINGIIGRASQIGS
ncbi:tetratricopeptide repeat protein [Iodidimonas sp. SYSU 1G8]|uniref:tetratricopeptide repeat protein n=1 Tax=Iodidimonas sp. SYSU 1G8 TaxID=3133967 RepID=UPI0031FECFA8